jgi:ABC-type lipoprotein export system ATPase subunit
MTQILTTSSVEYGADALIVCDNLVRIYQVENIEVQALQGLDLLVNKGEMIAIVGQSGSGKSTLLNVLSGLDVPTAGAARVAGWDLLRMTHADRLNYRRSVVGFVWQQTGRNLFPYLSARENVMLPMAFAGLSGSARIKRANALLETMGMAAMAGRRPHQLSGGEQQRVAIAVALANNPEVIFADEPTGELDSATGDDVFEALRSANRDLGATVVVVTHDHAVSSQVQRTVAIRDGRTATEVVRRTHIDDQGQTQTFHEEYAVLDRAGRMQVPKDYRAALGLKDRVRLELEDDHLGVWADGVPRKPPLAPEPPAESPGATEVTTARPSESGQPDDERDESSATTDSGPDRYPLALSPTQVPGSTPVADVSPYGPPADVTTYADTEADADAEPDTEPDGGIAAEPSPTELPVVESPSKPPAPTRTVSFTEPAPRPDAATQARQAAGANAFFAHASHLQDEDLTPYQPVVPAPPSPWLEESEPEPEPAPEPEPTPERAPEPEPEPEPALPPLPDLAARSPYLTDEPHADQEPPPLPWLVNKEDDDE